jgi:hypothetical protein
MDGQKYLGLLDMIDGGGMGRAGQRFEGGGLLSDIANALARPAGYMDRMAAVRPQARPMQAGLPDMPMIQTPPPQQSPLEMFGGQAPNSSPIPVQQSPLEMFGGQPPAPYTPPLQYSGRGTAGMPYPQFAMTPEQRATLDYLRSIGYVNY